MNNVTLQSFPNTKTEALAMLYVQSRDLTNATPEELLAMYKDAYNRIREANKISVKNML